MTSTSVLTRLAIVCAVTSMVTGTSSAKTGHEPHQPAKAQHPSAEVPPVTDEDRRAAFPDVEGHAVHDDVAHYHVLFDQLEWQTDGDTNALSIDNKGWVGGI